jgi:putative acetyltransferase
MIEIIEAGHPDLPVIRRLLLAYASSLSFDLAFQKFDDELAALPHPYVRPRGLMLIAMEAGDAKGVGAYRPLDDDVAEIKRMYVVPSSQGKGVGRLLLDRLIAEARAAGHRRLRLDTDRASMAGAIRLYRSVGFVEIAPYGPDRDGQLAFFEKRLDAD